MSTCNVESEETGGRRRGGGEGGGGGGGGGGETCFSHLHQGFDGNKIASGDYMNVEMADKFLVRADGAGEG
eukprot:455496-Hanusia_phi.AAC.1